MTDKKLFSFVFGLPGLAALIYGLARRPGAGDAPTIAAVTFGSLLVLILAGVIVLPLVLRWRGERERSDRTRRAAIEGIGVPVFSTFLWSIVFLPGSPGQRIIAGVSGAVLTLIATALAERRLRHE